LALIFLLIFDCNNETSKNYMQYFVINNLSMADESL